MFLCVLLLLAVGGFLNFVLVSFTSASQWFAEILDGNVVFCCNVWYFSYSMALCIALLHAFRLNKERKKSNSIEACTHSNSGEWNFLSVGISCIDVVAIAVLSILVSFHLLFSLSLDCALIEIKCIESNYKRRIFDIIIFGIWAPVCPVYKLHTHWTNFFLHTSYI